MKTSSLILFVLTVLLLTCPSFGADGKGGQPGAIRDLSIGGRPAAMGGAFAAIAEGSIGHLFNPAGLAQTRRYGGAFAYRAMHLDRRLGYAAVTIPAKENATLGFSWLYAGTADLEARNDQGYVIPGEVIGHSENLIAVTFAKRFGPRLLLGGKLFYIQNNIANLNAYTVGVDLGGMYPLPVKQPFLKRYVPLVQMAMVVQNLGANYRWVTGKYWEGRGVERGASVDEAFPTVFRPGLAFLYPGKYTAAIDLEMTTASMIKSHFGVEYTPHRLLALRAGLDDMHPTMGIGLFKRFDKIGLWIDLAYLTDKVGEGDDLLISLEMVF